MAALAVASAVRAGIGVPLLDNAESRGSGRGVNGDGNINCQRGVNPGTEKIAFATFEDFILIPVEPGAYILRPGNVTDKV